MADRRAELERKKQRLAQLKEEKERRRREKEQIVEVSKSSDYLNSCVLIETLFCFSLFLQTDLTSVTSSNLRSEADQLLLQLGIPTVSGNISHPLSCNLGKYVSFSPFLSNRICCTSRLALS